MNKEKLIDLIESLGIDYNEFWILSTGSLVLRGLWDKANDLDIAVTEKGLKELHSKYNLIQKENGFYIVNDMVECVQDTKDDYKVEKVGKYYLQSLEYYYEYLDGTKRDKDKEKYKIVKKILNR